MIKIIVFLLIFSATLFKTSIAQSYKICDKSQNISIDSAMTETIQPKGQKRLTLFAGEDIYELEPIGVNERPKIISHKTLADLSPKLIAPISVAQVKGKLMVLNNREKRIEWEFTDRKLDSETQNKDLFDPDAIEAVDLGDLAPHYVSHKKTQNGQAISFLDIRDKTTKIFIKKSENRKQMISSSEMSSRLDAKEEVFTKLNGIDISAVYVSYDAQPWVWYLMAGRLLCRMEVETKPIWKPFCPIQDITDWIDCPNITTTTAESTSAESTSAESTSVDNTKTNETPVLTPIPLLLIAFIAICIQM